MGFLQRHVSGMLSVNAPYAQNFQTCWKSIARSRLQRAYWEHYGDSIEQLVSLHFKSLKAKSHLRYSLWLKMYLLAVLSIAIVAH